MGEAKRRGTFEQRREQAQAKRAALFAVRPPEPERPVLALPRRNLREAAVMMAALESLAMSQGVFIIRPRPNNAVRVGGTPYPERAGCASDLGATR